MYKSRSCPETSCTIQHTIHSLFFCFFVLHFRFFFINHPRFFIRDFVPSFFVSTTSQSAFFPGLTEAQDMVQNGMLWLEHTPPPFLAGPGQPGSCSGHNISPARSCGLLKGASSCAGPGGPTWRNTWRKKQREKRWKTRSGKGQRSHKVWSKVEICALRHCWGP